MKFCAHFLRSTSRMPVMAMPATGASLALETGGLIWGRQPVRQNTGSTSPGQLPRVPTATPQRRSTSHTTISARTYTSDQRVATGPASLRASERMPRPNKSSPPSKACLKAILRTRQCSDGRCLMSRRIARSARGLRRIGCRVLLLNSCSRVLDLAAVHFRLDRGRSEHQVLRRNGR